MSVETFIHIVYSCESKIFCLSILITHALTLTLKESSIDKSMANAYCGADQQRGICFFFLNITLHH